MDPIKNINKVNNEEIGIQSNNLHSLPPLPFPIPPKLDARLLAHVAADFIAYQDKSLQGNKIEYTSAFLLDVLQEIINNSSEKNEKWKGILKTIVSMHAYDDKIQKYGKLEYKKRLEKLDKLVKNFLEDIKSLKSGERLFFPGGWISVPQGHAIVHAIEKIGHNPSSYKFYTYNTGDGANNFHFRFRNEEGENRYQSLYCIENISEENILNPLFYRALFEPQLFSYEIQDNGKEASVLYNSILPLLKGTETIPSKEYINFHVLQRSGTCAWKCIMAYIKSILSVEEYKNLSFYVKFITLERFLDSSPLEEQPVENLVLVANIAQKLIRSLNKNWISISEEKQRKFLSLLIEVRGFALELKERKIKENEEDRYLSFTNNGAYSDINFNPLQDSISEFVNEKAIPLSDSKILLNPPEMVQITPKNVSEQLDVWLNYCEELYKKGDYYAARNSINQILKILPEATCIAGKDPFWDSRNLLWSLAKGTGKKIISKLQSKTEIHLTGDDLQREQLILKIGRLNDLLYKSVMHLRSFNGEDIYCVLHSIAIQVQLMSNIIGFVPEKYAKIPFGVGGIGPYEMVHSTRSSKFKGLNFFATSDELKDKFKKLIKRFPHNSGIRYFLKEGKSNYHSILQKHLEKKAKEINLQVFKEKFKFLYTSDIGQRNLLPPFLAAINKQSLLYYLFISFDLFQKQPNFENFNPDFEPFEMIFPSTEFLLKNPSPFFPSLELNGVGKIERKLSLTVEEDWLQKNVETPAVRFIINQFHSSKANGNIFAISNLIEDKDLQLLSLEERRELLILSQTPSSIRVWQTIAYFSRYWDRLEESDFQALFDLFTTPILKEEIHRNPENLKKILTFLKQGLEQFASPHKLKGFLYCIHFGIKVYSRLHIDFKSEKETFDQALNFWEKELIKKLHNPQSSPADKQAIHVELAHLMLQRPYSTEQHAQILLAKTCQEASPLPLFLKEDNFSRLLVDYLQSNRQDFFSSLTANSAYATQVFNDITRLHFNQYASAWKLQDYPYFTDSSETMRINVLTGQIKCLNSVNVPLPKRILDNGSYKELFGKMNFSTQMVNFNLFVFSNGSHFYRIEDGTNLPSPIIKIEVCFNDRWYRFIPKNEVGKNSTFKPLLIEGYTHWVSVDKPRHVLINNPLMETVYEGNLSDGKINILNAKDHSRIFSEVFPPFLKNFENEGYIECWKDENNCFKELSFPRYGLHLDFPSDNPKKAFFREFPGYYLKSIQDVPSLAFLRHFLLIENHQGEKKILIPLLEMQAAQSSSSLSPKVIPKPILPFRYLTIHLDVNGRPYGINGEQAFYLFYIALVENQFSAAKEYLDQFSKVDVKGNLDVFFALITSWCVNTSPPKDPITKAMGLRAIGLLLEMIKFSSEVQADWKPQAKHIESLFTSYINNKNNACSHSLSEEEERNLLLQISSKTPLGLDCFSRLLKLQSRRPLKEEVFFPEKIQDEILTHEFSDSERHAARVEVNTFIEECKNPWSGSDAIFDDLLTRPTTNLIPFFLDCVLNFEKWKNEPFQSLLQDHLKLLRNTSKKGTLLLHDCLKTIFEDPLFFEKNIKELQEVRKQILGNLFWKNELLQNWFFSVIKRFQQINPPVSTTIEMTEILPYTIAQGLNHPSFLNLKNRPLTSLLTSVNIEELFCENEKINKERIPPLKYVPDNPAANEQIDKLNKQLDAFYSKPSKHLVYSLNKQKMNSQALQECLNLEESSLLEVIQKLEQKILDLAAKEPQEKFKFFYEKQAAGGTKTSATLDELISYFSKGDIKSTLKKCPGLNEDTCQDLFNVIFIFLQESTRYQQIKRAQKIVDNIVNYEMYIDGRGIEGFPYPEKDEAFLMIADYENQLAKELIAKPAYEMHVKPQYLVLEYYSNIRLRNNQIDTLELFLSGKGLDSTDVKELIVQLTMGSGKTKVLLPLLANLMADGENLPIIVVPPALLEINKYDLAGTSLHAFGQRPFVLEFNRNSSLEVADLEHLLFTLQNLILDRRYLITDPSSLKSLGLKWKELIFLEMHQKSPNPQREAQFDLLRRIILLLKERGISILDEADLLLENRRSEVNFPIGKAMGVTKRRKDLIKELLSIFFTPPYKELAQLNGNELRDIKEENILKIKKKFIERILEKYSLPDFDQSELFSYLIGEQKFPPNLEGHPYKQIFVDAHKLASSILPIVIKKNGNVNYGRSYNPSIRYAIPYVGNNMPDESKPSNINDKPEISGKRSEFGQIDEIMLYSAFIYMQEGLKPSDVDFLVEEMLRKIRMEAKSTHKSFSETKTFAFCAQRFKIKDIFNLSDQDKEKCALSVKNDFKALKFWLNHFVYPDIKIFTQKLSANSYDLVNMSKRNIGFSGYVWNRSANPNRLRHPELDEILDHPEDDIAILDAVWRKLDGKKGIHVVDSSFPHDFIEALLKLPNLVCLLDTGAILRGISNQEAAETIQKKLEKEGRLKGTLYFNEKNQIVVHLDNQKPVTLDEIGINERFSYYDQVHTTGSDIKQPLRGKAILTFTQNTLRDFAQGAMRMRDLLNLQLLEILIPKTTADKMNELGDPSFNDIITTGVVNQSNRLADEIDLSARQGLRHVNQKISDFMLHCETLKEAAAIFEKFEPILTDISKEESEFSVMKPTLETLVNMRDGLLIEIEKLFDQEIFLSEDKQKQLKILGEEILMHLAEFKFPKQETLPKERPEGLTSAQQFDSRVEIEREVEVTQESQLNKIQAAYFKKWKYSSSPSYEKDFFTGKDKYAPQIISFESIFENSGSLKKFEGIFDPQLRTTENFIQTVNHSSEAFIPNAQKHCYHLVFYKEFGQLVALMVDPIEAGWLRKILPVEEQIKNNGSKHKPYPHQVLFLDLENGFFDQMGEKFTLGEQKKMLELTVQAKFLNGDLNYSPEQWDYLKSWLNGSENIGLLKELFELSVNSQPGQFKFYEKSDIYNLLKNYNFL